LSRDAGFDWAPGHLVARCPMCGHEEIDHDDVGFEFCVRCHYCVHAHGDVLENGRMKCRRCAEEFGPTDEDLQHAPTR
jgi:hypothetical protein